MILVLIAFILGVVNNDPVTFLPIYPYVHSGIRIDAKTLDWWEYDELLKEK